MRFEYLVLCFQQSALTSSLNEDDCTNGDEKDDEMTLETILSKVGLSDKVSLFQQEQIDMESLVRFQPALYSYSLVVVVVVRNYCCSFLKFYYCVNCEGNLSLQW